MPTIIVNKQSLLHLAGKKLPDEILKDRIEMLGLSVESMNDKEIEIEVYPNRPDCLSEEGIARLLSAFINLKPGLKTYKVKKSNYKFKIDPKVKKIRPAVAAAVIKNITLDDATLVSIMQLQEKLHTTHGRNRKKVSIGVYDLDKIEFPLIYTTKPKLFSFTPLETNKKLALSEILETHPKGKAFAHLLKDFEEYPIWLDKNATVLSMPPIINSEDTKITEQTTNLFIDCTGLDQRAVEQALNIIVCALADHGAEIYSVNEFPNLEPQKLKLNFDYVNKLLNLNLNKNEIKQLLAKMNIGLESNTALVPAYRTDIMHEIDLVEDIAIAYGYENFEEVIPNISTLAQENPLEIFKRKIAEILIGFNLLETNSFTLTSKQELSKMENKIEALEIENPSNEEYTVLRPWLLPCLLKTLQLNTHNEYPQNLFEIGTCFQNKKEITKLAIVLCHDKADFTSIKQVLDSLFSNLGLECKIEDVNHGSFVSGRVGKILVKNKKIAYIGELHPKVLSNYNLTMPVSCLELDLSELFEIWNTI